MDRIASTGCLRLGGVRHVLLALDEALLQEVDTLGQEVFLADRARMMADGQVLDAMRATLRTWGYSANLRQLREPGTLQRLVAAVRGSVEPIGGGAAEHLGYRAGTGALQHADAAARQNAGSFAPPSEVNIRHLWRTLDLLSSHDVTVTVVYPPLLNREVLYLADSGPGALPFRAVATELARRGVRTVVLTDGEPRLASQFVNVGHLNDLGAQRYSRLLADSLKVVWTATVPMARP